MSTRRTSKEAGWVWRPSTLPRGPGGRALCRRCGQEVPRGRRTFCSAACVHEHKVRTNPGYVRTQVFARDQGVCAVCGLDTVAEEQRLRLEISAAAAADWRPAQARFAVRLGADFCSRRKRGFWDADHIAPVVEGGGECGLDNYRTLCIPCHRSVTAALRRRLAAARREGNDHVETD
jgi:5-methylcytosine-specific restriction protein A